MLTFGLFILCAVLFLVSIFCDDNNYWQRRNIIEIKGVLLKFILNKHSLSEIYKNIYDDHPFEHQVGLFLGRQPALLLKDLKNIHTVLAGDFQHFHSRGIVVNKRDLLADNLLFMNDYFRWKLVRQKLTPVFTSARLKNMFYIIERCARDFTTTLEKNESLRKSPFDTLYAYTTAAIGASIFGLDTQTKNTMDSPFLDMAKKAVAPTFQGNLRFFMANTFKNFFMFFNMKQFGEYEDFFINVVKKVLLDRKNTEKRNDFIDLCLELKKQGTLRDLSNGYELKATDELLAAQAFFFFLAGTDTSSNALHFTLLEISNNSDVLFKLHTEVDIIFDNCKENIKYEDIEHMKYLDMVISEALRKYPPIGVVQRVCANNTVLPVGAIEIKKNEVVLIPIYAIHRDAKYFPNPDKFDPERFSPENLKNVTKYSYIPFGEGNRICIGARFARLQLKVAIAWFLRRFTLKQKSCSPERFEPSFFSLRAPEACYEIIYREQKN